MALKTEQTWVVSRHAEDLPSLARIMAFYGGERVEEGASRATSDKGSARGSADMQAGSASTSAREAASRPDADAVFAAEIATVGAFVRRLETIVGALQAQMAAYDPTMPRTQLVPVWREIGDRIAGIGGERRKGSSSRQSVSDLSTIRYHVSIIFVNHGTTDASFRTSLRQLLLEAALGHANADESMSWDPRPQSCHCALALAGTGSSWLRTRRQVSR